jgi:hypothetical protein
LGVQIHPARQQQAAFVLHYTAHAPTFPKELRSAHFADGFVGVLQNVEFVVHDAAVRSLWFDTVGERPPHIHASRRNALPLTFLQRGSKKRIQRFLAGDPVRTIMARRSPAC